MRMESERQPAGDEAGRFEPGARACPPQDFQMDGWLVQPTLGRMTRGGTIVRLRPQLMDLLCCLALRAGRTLTKEEIFERVWPDHFIADTGLARCVAELRHVFDDDAREPRVIETIPKRGYRLLADIVFVDEPAPANGNGHAAAPDSDANGADRVGEPRPGEPATAAPEPVEAKPHDPLPAVPPESVASRLGGWLTRFWIPLAGALVLGVAGAVAAAAWRAGGPAAFSGRDTIVLAFDNATGDPVFDGTLKLALAVQLEQSPYLRILSDEKARDTLRYMGRRHDEPMTRAVARDICPRAGAKAILSSSISMMGTHYVIGLEAIACETGESLAREQVEVDRKEQVLVGLGRAASSIRAKLGESLASIRQLDVPLVQATTRRSTP